MTAVTRVTTQIFKYRDFISEGAFQTPDRAEIVTLCIITELHISLHCLRYINMISTELIIY